MARKPTQSKRPGPRGGASGEEAGRLLRALPSVARLLEEREFGRLVQDWGAGLTTDLLREEIERVRGEVLAGALDADALSRAVTPEALADRVERAARDVLEPSPRSVINATGVVVHTNLGRSLLSDAASRRLAVASRAYMDLEYDLGTGRRGSRLAHLEPLLERLFPGHGSLVVNNNAAAVMLALRALARRREVVVSRGELVEIGGSFRMPDIMAASGARLREVGTTNRTRLADYEEALSPRTGMILKVHTSNFKIVGFVEETTIGALAGLARDRSIPLVVDWGSGDLVDLGVLGIQDEIPVRRILDEGADLVTFSGDKLLGGPQAGFVVGRPDLVRRLRRDPLARVCRLDRLLVCTLRETLSAYVRGREFQEIPTLRMIAMSREEIGLRAARVMHEVGRRSGKRSRLSLVDGESKTGGGSSPTGGRPTRLIAVTGAGEGDAGGLERALVRGEPPVVARVHESKLLIDLRTVLPDQEEALTRRLVEVLAEE